MSRKFLETIRSVDGVVQNLSYHQERLERVLHSLKTTQHYTLQEQLSPPREGVYKNRVVYDENEIEIRYIPYERRTIRSLKLLFSDDIEYSQKYLDRVDIERLFELRGACDDILIVKSGLITDSSIANVAFFDGSVWLTPKRPLLRGTARQRHLESGLIIEKDIFVEDLKEFQAVALMNAMIDFDIISRNIEESIC